LHFFELEEPGLYPIVYNWRLYSAADDLFYTDPVWKFRFL